MNKKAFEQFKRELHISYKGILKPYPPFLQKLWDCYKRAVHQRRSTQGFYIWVSEACSEDLAYEFSEHELMELFR